MEQIANNKNRKVPWIIFVWAIGIFTLALGWIFTSLYNLDSKVEVSKIETTDMKVMMAEIKTDVSWIKQMMEKSQNIQTIKK